MHGGKSTGAPKGNQNAWKHGRYTAKAISERRTLSQLIRECRDILLGSYEAAHEELQRERFGADGPLPGVKVIFICKFASRSVPAEAA
jgi:hypothetical protein